MTPKRNMLHALPRLCALVLVLFSACASVPKTAEEREADRAAWDRFFYGVAEGSAQYANEPRKPIDFSPAGLGYKPNYPTPTKQVQCQTYYDGFMYHTSCQ